MGKTIPVIKLALSLHKKCIAPLSSSALPKRFIGVFRMIFSPRSVQLPSSFKKRDFVYQ